MVGAVAAALSAVALVVAVVLIVSGTRAAREMRAEQGRELGAIRDELRAEQATTWISLRTAVHVCVADNSVTTCTITNPTTTPITTCFKGTLTQKKARGVHLSSLVACTGRIGPRETRTVSTPWSGGFARDVCSSTNRFGTEMLDWEVCDFTQEPVEVDAVEKLAQGVIPG
jgi:hypothetical protein